MLHLWRVGGKKTQKWRRKDVWDAHNTFPMGRPVESAVSNREKRVFSGGNQRSEAGAGILTELCWYLERCFCFCSHAQVVSPKLTQVGSSKARDVLTLHMGSQGTSAPQSFPGLQQSCQTCRGEGWGEDTFFLVLGKCWLPSTFILPWTPFLLSICKRRGKGRNGKGNRKSSRSCLPIP